MITLDFETHAVRVVVIKKRKWWVAADVCRVLGLDNSTRAIESLDDDERRIIGIDRSGARGPCF